LIRARTVEMEGMR